MPNSQIPPNQPPDLYTMIFTMMENLGRNTQMVADTRDTVSDIRSTQQTQVIKMTQLESAILEIAKDHTSLVGRVEVNEKRTTDLEDAEKKRKWFIGLFVGLVSIGTTFIGWVILNWNAISKVIHGIE